jgi:hypothetical protein
MFEPDAQVTKRLDSEKSDDSERERGRHGGG